MQNEEGRGRLKKLCLSFLEQMNVHVYFIQAIVLDQTQLLGVFTKKQMKSNLFVGNLIFPKN